MALPVIGGSDGAWGTVLTTFLGGAAGDGTPTIPTNRIPYMIGTNLTSSANLTFDGTTLTIPAVTLSGIVSGGGNVLNNLGHIGIGATTAPTVGLYFVETIALSATQEFFGYNSTLTPSRITSAFSGNVWANYSAVQIGATNTQNWDGDGTHPTPLVGVWGKIACNAGATGTISGGASLVASSNWAAATLTNRYGVFVMDATGNGTITNQYGIFIQSMTKGGNNWGVYSQGGQNYFGGKVGFGTTSPQRPIHAVQGAGSLPGTLAADHLAIFQNNANTTDIARIIILGGNAGYSVLHFADADAQSPGYIQYDHTLNAMSMYSASGVGGIFLNSVGNVGVGTETFGVGAVRVLTLANGTAPGGKASTASIVALAGELWGYDAGGTGTQQTSHPKEVMDAADPLLDPFPFGFKSRNAYLGKETIVDWTSLIRQVEALSSGKKFMVVRDLPLEERRDWDKDQEQQEWEQAAKRAAWLKDPNDKKGAEPQPHIKQRPAKWMVDRGVISNIK